MLQCTDLKFKVQVSDIFLPVIFWGGDWNDEPYSHVDVYKFTIRDRKENGHNSDREDSQKDEQHPGWKWKVASCAGLLLAGFLKSEKFSIFPDWFTVHAAKPLGGDVNSGYYDRRGSQSSDTCSNNELNGTLKLNKRQQFNFIADVVETASKAVVCIEVKDHSMTDWFHRAPQTASNGSGFIISEDGLILTNAHVVNTRGRTSISVCSATSNLVMVSLRLS